MATGRPRTFPSMPALTDWTWMEVLVTVKAYPTISSKYGEAVCVAGVRLDGPAPEWIRLFPVAFRDLEHVHQFRKYEVIRLRAQRHTTDTRRETWRPDVDSIEVLRHVPGGGAWRERRALVEPLVGPTMCQLNRGRRGGADGPSLGLVRPRIVHGVKARPETAWSPGQLGTAGQGNLLTAKDDLVKPELAFSYHWRCEEPECKGHTQKIVDWELGESERSWGYTGRRLIDAVEARWVGDMCAPGREPLFFVGDQHTRAGQFLVLGTFWPARRPDENQLTLSLAA